MSSKKITKRAVVTVISAVTLGAASLTVIGCSKRNAPQYVGFIDAPQTLLAELGTYVVPEYDVVDENGMVLFGYNVKLKSVTDANGENITINNRAVTVDTAGIYDFVYTANSDGVADVTVKIDFADRTAPTINFDERNLPAFFITGNSYKIPMYTISGGYEQNKSYQKVFYIAEDKTETEVPVSANRFKVDKKSGSYAIRVHVEDEVGNKNEYEYIRKVDGPENFVENKVLYFDEAFGERQISLYQSDKYKGEYVSKTTAGAKVRDGENGAYKVSFDGVTETQYNEGLISMDVPAVIDITECIELEMYVYNDSDKDIIMGSQWWNDTLVEKGKWTRLTWAVDSEGWINNKNANNTKGVSTTDITGMTIRFMFDLDYKQQVIPTGDFYLSSMRAIPKVKSTVTAGDNVTLDRADGVYYTGETVTLTAAEQSGKTFDCFLVDGKPIIGNNFVARKEAHTVTAKYVDGTLTKDNMTWGVVESYETTGTDAKQYKIGENDNWVLSYDLYGIGGEGWNWFGAYVGGENQLVGIELAGTTVHKAIGYYAGVDTPFILSDEVTALLRGATEQKPVTAIYVREGNVVKLLLKSAEKTYLVGTWDFESFGVSGNSFGIGERVGNGLVNATLKNIKGVAGAERVAAFNQNLKVEITKTSVKTDKTDYYLGDTVTLTADPAPADKAFAYFKVNNERITGNSFVIKELKPYAVEAVYLSPEETYKVTVAEHADRVKLDNDSKYALPVATVKDNDGNVKDYEVTVDEVVDAAGNRYTVTDGKISITYVGSVHLTITYTAKTLNSEYNTVTIHVTVQSGDTMYAPTSTTLGYVKNADDKTSSFEFVTDKKHGTDEGSVKVAPGEADTGFTVEDFDFTGYDYAEFYAYTEGEGVQAGAYWLGDTTLTANEWTKILIDLKGNVYLKDLEGKDFVPNSIHKGQPFMGRLVIRVMNNAQKSPVWISSVVAGNWAEATIVCDENVTLDKESYKVNDEVTLTAKEATDGQIFSHFTVDGKKIAGNKFRITETRHEVKAVYTSVSTVSFAADSGISTEGGETEYAIGETVTLLFDEGKAPSGQVFDCFLVDGKKINGNTFVTSAGTHEVTVSFITSASEMTWTTTEYVTPSGSIDDWGKYQKLGSAYNWVLSYDVTKTNADSTKNKDIPNMWYTGVLFRNNQIVGFHLGDNDGKDGSGNNYVKYFGSAGSGDGNTWEQFNKALNGDMYNAMQAASTSDPVKLIFIRQGNKLSVYVKSGDVIYTVLKDFTHAAFDTQYGLDFGYGWRTDCGGTPDIADIQWITGEGKVGLYTTQSLKSTVTATKATTDKTEYYIGDTVTLTAAAAADGEAFSHFTVDGAKISGKTFTVTKLAHTVEAVYTNSSAIDLKTDGISTEDGETEYARGVTVTLLFDESKAPSGQVFDRFLVDGTAINGNTFVTSGAKHEITAEFVTTASEMHWATTAYVAPSDTVPNAGVYHKLGSADNWVLSYDVTKTNANSTDNAGIPNQWFTGVLFRNNQIVGFHLGENDQHAKYFGSAGNGDGSTWDRFKGGLDASILNAMNSASASNPVKLIFIRQGNKLSVYVKSGDVIYTVLKDFTHAAFDTQYGLDFGYGWRTGCGGNPDIADIQWITGAGKVGLYTQSLKSTVTATKATTDRTEYYIGDEVILTQAAASDGEAFSHFTVDGVKISGNKFTVTKLAHTVVAEYVADVSTLTLGEGVMAYDESGITHTGTMTAAKGAQITLEYNENALNAGQALDCFKVNNEKIVGCTFTASESAYSVEAVIVDSVDNLTWQTKTKDENNTECLNSGEGIYAVKLGKADDWAVRYTITELPKGEWGQLAGVYIGGTNQIAQLQFSGSTYAFALYGGPVWSDGHSVSVPSDVAAIITGASSTSPVTLAFVKRGNWLTAYAIDHTVDGDVTYVCGNLSLGDYINNASATNDFGYAYRDGAAKFGEPTLSGTLDSIFGASKVKLYDETLSAQTGRMSENQINAVNKGVVKASNSGNYTSGYITTDVPAGLSDPNIKENGVLKINALGNEVSFTSKTTFDFDTSKYSEIYFYVYIEKSDKSTQTLNHVAGGSYWKDGNSYAIDSTNKWVKISFDSALIAKLDGGAATDLSKFVFRIYTQTWLTDPTDITGYTLYVTSLYGVPKSVEPLVENGATSYSLVCDDGELKEVLNESFFPDAE